LKIQNTFFFRLSEFSFYICINVTPRLLIESSEHLYPDIKFLENDLQNNQDYIYNLFYAKKKFNTDSLYPSCIYFTYISSIDFIRHKVFAYNYKDFFKFRSSRMNQYYDTSSMDYAFANTLGMGKMLDFYISKLVYANPHNYDGIQMLYLNIQEYEKGYIIGVPTDILDVTVTIDEAQYSRQRILYSYYTLTCADLKKKCCLAECFGITE